MWRIRTNSSHACDKYEVWKIRFNKALLPQGIRAKAIKDIFGLIICHNKNKVLKNIIWGMPFQNAIKRLRFRSVYVFKRVKFVILNVSLHYGCNNGRGCRNKCTRKRVLRTCIVCVVPVRMRPLMSFPHTKSNNAHAKLSKSKTNPGPRNNHTMRNNFVDFFLLWQTS